jgi:hypothetical protein
MALGMTLAIQDRFNVILLSEDISKDQAEGMGFHYASTLQKAFERSAQLCPPNPEVHIVPVGGIMLPVL